MRRKIDGNIAGVQGVSRIRVQSVCGLITVRCCNLRSEELGMSCYCGWGWCNSPLAPCTSHSSILCSSSLPLILLLSQEPMGVLGIAQWASCSVPIEWRTTTRRLRVSRWAEFEIPPNSDYHFHFDVALSIYFLKLWKYWYILSAYNKTFLSFHFEQFESVDLIMQVFYFRVAEISFYIDNPRRFWNSVNGDYKTHSHGK